jgi:hypothetical protein
VREGGRRKKKKKKRRNVTLHRVKTYHDAIKNFKELPEFAVQWNDSDMFSLRKVMQLRE